MHGLYRSGQSRPKTAAAFQGRDDGTGVLEQEEWAQRS